MSFHYFALAGVLLLTVIGQLMIKARADENAAAMARGKGFYLWTMFTDFWVLSGLAAAIVAGALWMLAIQKLDLGYAYPFLALSFLLVPIGSMAILNEPLPPAQVAGLVLIVAGVTVSALAR